MISLVVNFFLLDDSATSAGISFIDQQNAGGTASVAIPIALVIGIGIPALPRRRGAANRPPRAVVRFQTRSDLVPKHSWKYFSTDSGDIPYRSRECRRTLLESNT